MKNKFCTSTKTRALRINFPPASKPFGSGRAFAFLVIGVLLVVLGALVWGYSIARSALPQLDGSLKVSGLSAKVTVIRDEHGVPTIEATCCALPVPTIEAI